MGRAALLIRLPPAICDVPSVSEMSSAVRVSPQVPHRSPAQPTGSKLPEKDPARVMAAPLPAGAANDPAHRSSERGAHAALMAHRGFEPGAAAVRRDSFTDKLTSSLRQQKAAGVGSVAGATNVDLTVGAALALDKVLSSDIDSD
jgi:hypothetical protein